MMGFKVRFAKIKLLAGLMVGGLCLPFSAVAHAGGDVLHLRWLDPARVVVAEVQLDTDQLEALAQKKIDTTTPWTEGVQAFSGPTLSALAGLGGRAPTEALVIALNDYLINIPASDWQRWEPILATRHNGARMPVREKGPFWVIYPMDKDQVLITQLYRSRMVWQVNKIDFLVP